jgi:hypothetical protein
MPVPEFEWKTYRVPLRTAEGLVVDPAVMVDVDLPDLTRWPRLIEKAEVLLRTAAEVEHALLVQYLYAAFSLNTALTGEQLTAVSEWQQKLIFIARQEMGHLMTVQNLRLALGCAPTFERDDFPLGPKLYPFILSLEPFTQASLAKYIVFESPLDEDLDAIPGFTDALAGSAVNHVGTIYGLLAFVFSAGDPKTTASSIWNTLMREVADAANCQDGDPAAWHLPDDAIIENPTAMQGASDIWGRDGIRPIKVWTITSRQSRAVRPGQHRQHRPGR